MGSLAVLQDLSKQAQPSQAQGKSSLDVLNEVAANPNLAYQNAPQQPEDKRSFLQIAVDNSPSGADPQNPANPTQQGLNQMSPEDRASAQKQLATTAAITAAGTLAAPALVDAAQLGSEYAEYGGQRLLQFSEAQLEKFAESYPHLSKLAGHLGYGAGVAGAYEVFKKLFTK